MAAALQARNFARKSQARGCEICLTQGRTGGRPVLFVLEEHQICKHHFRLILKGVSARIEEWNGVPLGGIERVVDDLAREIRKGAA